jgi:phosphoglycerol transferase MdoB-like AlkP superfamily enzyme
MKKLSKVFQSYVLNSFDWFWLLMVLIIFIKSYLVIVFIDSLSFLSTTSIPYYLLFITVLLSFAFLFKNKSRVWFLLSIDFLISFLMLADLWYFRGGYATFLNLHMMKATANLENLGECVRSFIHPQDILLVADLPLLLLFTNLKRFSGAFQRRRSILKFALVFLLSVIAICYVPFRYHVLGIESPRMKIFRICWAPKQTIANLSPLGFHFYDAFNYWKECQPMPLSPEEVAAIKQWFADKRENRPDNEYKGLFAGKNLLLIQVESLEAVVVGNKIDGQEIMPTLNKLKANSFYFPNIYEQVFNGTSSDSDFMVNTSVYPVRKGSTFFRFPKNTYNSLPKLLEKRGYQTLSYHGISGGFWNWMEAHYGIGFQKCFDKSAFNVDEIIGLGISDGSYLRQVSSMLTEAKEPFYAFTVTMSNHGPFNLPQQYRQLELDPEMDKSKLGGYFQTLHYTDQQIGLFLEALDQQGFLDNTVVVIYGDHGGMNKFYKDEVQPLPPPNDWWQPQEYNRSPLLIYHKGLEGKEIPTIGGQIDIMPTLAYLMGVDEEEIAFTAMGRNLLNTGKNHVVLAYGDVVGSFNSEEEKEKAVQGLLEIGDKIIRSNYFEKYFTDY